MKQIPSLAETDKGAAEDAGRRQLTSLASLMSRSWHFLILVIAVAWIANYLHFTDYGFYSDDWYFFGYPYVESPRIWFATMFSMMRHFLDGRPLHIAGMYIFGYLGAATANLAILYVSAFLFLSVSAILLYYVLRLRFPTFFCAIATLVFVLSPLVDLKQFLNGELTFGPALSFAFGAILLYFYRGRTYSYILGSFALLTYEPTFLLFMLAPLLQKRRPWRAGWRRGSTHILLCIIIVGIYASARTVLGQNRQHAAVAQLSLAAQAWNAVLYDLLFTVSSFKSYIYGLYVGARNISVESGLYCALFFIPLLLVLLRSPAASRTWKAIGQGKMAAARRRWWIQNGVVGGIIVTIVGYSFSYFTLYYDWVYPLSGRSTRVSETASVGSSIWVVSMAIVVVSGCRKRWMRRSAQTLVVVALSGLFLYSMVVQQDYVQGWSHERNFTTQLMMLSPDVNRDTLFIVKAPWVSESLFPGSGRRVTIDSEERGLETIIATMFGFDAPRLFIVYSDDWKNYLLLRSGKLYWTQAVFPGGWDRNTGEAITPGHIIVMEERDDGSLVRQAKPITIPQMSAPITQPPPAFSGKPESMWAVLSPSALAPRIVPAFTSAAVMVNAIAARISSARRVVKLAVKFPAMEMPAASGLSEPLLVSGQPGAGDFIEVRYYGQNTLRVLIDHWGIRGVQSEVMQYDPKSVYFVDVVMDDNMSASIAGGVTAVFKTKPYPATRSELTLGHNSIGGNITTQDFTGTILTSDIVE